MMSLSSLVHSSTSPGEEEWTIYSLNIFPNDVYPPQVLSLLNEAQLRSYMLAVRCALDPDLPVVFLFLE
jgi:hypothetical protein